MSEWQLSLVSLKALDAVVDVVDFHVYAARDMSRDTVTITR